MLKVCIKNCSIVDLYNKELIVSKVKVNIFLEKFFSTPQVHLGLFHWKKFQQTLILFFEAKFGLAFFYTDFGLIWNWQISLTIFVKCKYMTKNGNSICNSDLFCFIISWYTLQNYSMTLTKCPNWRWGIKRSQQQKKMASSEI